MENKIKKETKMKHSLLKVVLIIAFILTTIILQLVSVMSYLIQIKKRKNLINLS